MGGAQGALGFRSPGEEANPMSDPKTPSAGPTARPEDKTVHIGAGGAAGPLPGMPAPLPAAPQAAPPSAKTIVAYGTPNSVPAGTPAPAPAGGQGHAASTVI